MALAAWTIVGIFVDAYKHSTDPNLETFWTPWHALFYTGFLATAAWLFLLTVRRRSDVGGFFDWAPRGHRLALVGVGLFAAGGMGDAVWHSVFGVEESLDALLSPTHLLLWLGSLAIVSTPLRAAWSDSEHDDAAGMRTFAPILASLTLTLCVVAFFLTYAWQFVDTRLPRTVYQSRGVGEFEAAFGVMGILISTTVMMAAVLVPARRWRMPFGSMTVALTVVNLLMAVGFDDQLTALPAAIVAGIVGDLMTNAGLPRRLVAGVVPAVLWSGYFLLVGRLAPGLLWPPEIWMGAIVFAVLVGLAIDAGGDAAVDASGHSSRPRADVRTNS